MTRGWNLLRHSFGLFAITASASALADTLPSITPPPVSPGIAFGASVAQSINGMNFTGEAHGKLDARLADGTAIALRRTRAATCRVAIHKPDQPDSAESYVWGDPGTARIGINLLWMQASCGIDGMEQA